MRTVLQRLSILTMLLVGFYSLSVSNAAPVTSDIGATNQTTIVAALDQPAVLPSFFSSSNIPDRDALPGIVAVASTNNSTANFSTTSDGGYSAKVQQQTANDATNDSGRTQNAAIANSMNWHSTWTATYDDDDGANPFFFLSNTSATSAQQHPDYTLRC